MGLSIRAYARHLGVSETAVRKALKSGRIAAQADGTLDPATADAQWQRNTHAGYRRKGEGPAFDTSEGASAAGSNTFSQARTANEVLKAQHHKLRIAQLKGELIDRNQALAQVFQLARAERDAWLNWPARISTLLAAELGVDPHTFHIALEREVRQHLTELGQVDIRLD